MLVTLDVDGLGAIDERHGAAACEAVVSHLGGTLITQVRSTDAVGRLGGAEFALLLAFADEDGANRKMRKLSAKLSELPFRWNGQGLEVGIRYAMRPVGADEAEAQIALATAGLHASRVVMRVVG